MKRVGTDELRMLITIQLTVLRQPVRRAAGLSGDMAINTAVDQLMERIFDNLLVVAPDMAADAMHFTAGRFGKTEPWPWGLAPED